MIAEDYVSFNTSKLLKEKGFDIPLNYFYNSDGRKGYATSYNWNQTAGDFQDYSCPTLQMAMKWLREVHNITVIPNVRIPHPICGTIESYWVGIWYVPKNNGGAFCYTSPTPYEGYPSFEEACEAGIRYCLENLI